MNIYSIATAFLVVACVSLAVGLLSRRLASEYRHLGFCWAIALSFALSVPVLLSSGLTDLSRLFLPREAIDWMPIGLIVLAGIQTVSVMRSEFKQAVLLLAVAACVGLAARMLYGGIYFRAGSFEWTSAAWIVLWGGAVASCWLIGWERQVIVDWWEGGLSLVLIAVLAVALLLSGSVVYGFAAGLLCFATVFGWLGTARTASFVFAPATLLVGLGIAYAELSFISGALLTLSMGVLSSSGRFTKRGLRIALMLTAIGLSTAGVGLVVSKFIAATFSTDQSYSAYK